MLGAVHRVLCSFFDGVHAHMHPQQLLVEQAPSKNVHSKHRLRLNFYYAKFDPMYVYYTILYAFRAYDQVMGSIFVDCIT